MPRGRAQLAGCAARTPARRSSRRVACARPGRREPRAQQGHAGAPRRTTTDRQKTRGDHCRETKAPRRSRQPLRPALRRRTHGTRRTRRVGAARSREWRASPPREFAKSELRWALRPFAAATAAQVQWPTSRQPGSARDDARIARHAHPATRANETCARD